MSLSTAGSLRRQLVSTISLPQGSGSLKTSFGMRAARRFMSAVHLLPHELHPDDAKLGREFGPIVSRLFTGQRLFVHENLVAVMEAADRLVWHEALEADRIMLGLNIHKSDRKTPTTQLQVGFDVRYGFVRTIRSTGVIKLGPYSIERCAFCGSEHATLGPTSVKETAGWSHRSHCPYQVLEDYMPERSNWIVGHHDGYSHNEGSHLSGNPQYDLGHDMGGLAYQADLACGRTLVR